jgi:N-dimethylarginine dimethylaminohydrolase
MKIKEKEFEDFIEELKELAQQLGATIRFEKGDFKGGYCLIKDKKVVVINKFNNSQKKATILATALKALGIEQIYLSPRIREIIDTLTEET